jgi:hypothetical protein
MNTTTSQPIQPYDALGAQLRASPSGKGAPAGKAEEYMAVSNHCTWIAGVLKLNHSSQSALAQACLLYPQEDGLFDIVRGACAVGGVTVATASSLHVLCLRLPVSDNDNNQTVPMVLAQTAAKGLFDLPANALVFKEMGVEGDTHYGIRDFSAGKPLDQDWPHWGDALAWWCDGREAAFITTKAPGGPTQETIMPSADQNRYWFTPPSTPASSG